MALNSQQDNKQQKKIIEKVALEKKNGNSKKNIEALISFAETARKLTDEQFENWIEKVRKLK